MSLAVGWNRCVVTPILLPSKGILVLRHAHADPNLNLIGGSGLSQRAANREAVDESRAITEVLARSVAEPAIPRGLVDGRAGAIDRLDRTVLDRLLVDDVQRIKIWNADGRID